MARVKRVSTGKIKRFFSQDHLEVDRAMENLKNALFNLRYEDKASLAKNLTDTKHALHFLETKLIAHMAMEEKAMFPLVKRSFPKYGPLIRFFCAEHKNLKKYIREIRHLLRGSSERSCGSKKAGETVRTLRECGFCLLYLLRGHGRAENASVYRASRADR